MRARAIVMTASLLVAIVLSGCGGVTPDNTGIGPGSIPTYGANGTGAHYGSISGDDLPLFSFGRGKNDDSGGGTGLGVNAYLWRGALDTLVVHAAGLGRPVRRRDHHRLVSAADGRGRAVQGDGLHPGPAAPRRRDPGAACSARCCRAGSGWMRRFRRRPRRISRTRCWQRARELRDADGRFIGRLHRRRVAVAADLTNSGAERCH